MGSLEISLLLVAAYICIYSIVDRVCKCKESCALYKAYGTYASLAQSSRNAAASNVKLDEFLKSMANSGGNNKQS